MVKKTQHSKMEKHHDVDKIRRTECGNLRFFFLILREIRYSNEAHFSQKSTFRDSWTVKIGSLRGSESSLISREAELFFLIFPLYEITTILPQRPHYESNRWAYDYTKFSQFRWSFHAIFFTKTPFFTSN